LEKAGNFLVVREDGNALGEHTVEEQGVARSCIGPENSPVARPMGGRIVRFLSKTKKGVFARDNYLVRTDVKHQETTWISDRCRLTDQASAALKGAAECAGPEKVSAKGYSRGWQNPSTSCRGGRRFTIRA